MCNDLISISKGGPAFTIKPTPINSFQALSRQIHEYKMAYTHLVRVLSNLANKKTDRILQFLPQISLKEVFYNLGFI
jgi:hypothetical protein